jgi:dTDP-4-dehydrorhamnose reductase
MTYLVTGANGQLGLCMREVLGESAEYAGHSELDITDEEAVKAWFQKREYDFVINCAAYTAVDKAEDEPQRAMILNADAAGLLAKYGKRIIHISTDYVFAGDAKSPISETEKTEPKGAYGKTKLAGEKLVLEYAETAAVVRTAWLVSEHGNNFLKTMRRLGGERPELGVVADQFGTPTYARDLAAAIKTMLPKIKTGSREIYHFTNEGETNWYEFAKFIMEKSGLPCKVNPITTAEYPTKAPRPAYSVLDKSKIKQTFDIAIRHWTDAVAECIGRL